MTEHQISFEENVKEMYATLDKLQEKMYATLDKLQEKMYATLDKLQENVKKTLNTEKFSPKIGDTVSYVEENKFINATIIKIDGQTVLCKTILGDNPKWDEFPYYTTLHLNYLFYRASDIIKSNVSVLRPTASYAYSIQGENKDLNVGDIVYFTGDVVDYHKFYNLCGPKLIRSHKVYFGKVSGICKDTDSGDILYITYVEPNEYKDLYKSKNTCWIPKSVFTKHC